MKHVSQLVPKFFGESVTLLQVPRQGLKSVPRLEREFGTGRQLTFVLKRVRVEQSYEIIDSVNY